MSHLFTFVYLVVFSVNFSRGNENPQPLFKAFLPKGFLVSIPDDGISLFSFHGNLNKKIETFEPGNFSKDMTKAVEGRWEYRDEITELKIGDVIYYWIYILKDGLGYLQKGNWTVTELGKEIKHRMYFLSQKLLRERHKINPKLTQAGNNNISSGLQNNTIIVTCILFYYFYN